MKFVKVRYSDIMGEAPVETLYGIEFETRKLYVIRQKRLLLENGIMVSCGGKKNRVYRCDVDSTGNRISEVDMETQVTDIEEISGESVPFNTKVTLEAGMDYFKEALKAQAEIDHLRGRIAAKQCEMKNKIDYIQLIPKAIKVANMDMPLDERLDLLKRSVCIED